MSRNFNYGQPEIGNQAQQQYDAQELYDLFNDAPLPPESSPQQPVSEEDLGIAEDYVSSIMQELAEDNPYVAKQQLIKNDEAIDRIKKGLGIDYSEEQVKIISHSGTPLNVISCAGSGKTAVLIAKMFYRELAHNISPENMLAITFNNKASMEIRTRYMEGRRKVGTRGTPEFKTYHALFLMLLRNIPKYRTINVVSHEKYTFQLYKLLPNDDTEFDKTEVLQAMFSIRSYLINNGHSRDGIENYTHNSKNSNSRLFSEYSYFKVMEKYNSLKKQNREIDFDDMMILLLHEIEENKNTEIIATFRNLYHDIYIDEYQDISQIQMEIMNHLIADVNRLVVIGDDDQASAKRYSISG